MYPRLDENHIRQEALLKKVCMLTTIMGAYAAIKGIEAMKNKELDVKSLQEYMAILNETKK